LKAQVNPMLDKLIGSLESKRVWLTLGSILFIALKDKIPLTEQQFQEVLLMLGSLVIGDSIRSVSPEKTKDA